MEKYSDRFSRTPLYLEFMEEVRRDNATFEAASDAEKRVIIAKDALRHAEVGIFMPETMSYGTGVLPHMDEPQELRAVLLEQAPRCEACARGGLVFSTILRRNNISETHFPGDRQLEEFPPTMLEDIEAAFEAGHMWDSSRYNQTENAELVDLILEWREVLGRSWRSMLDFDHVRYRFKRVMQWIIDHDGEFDLRSFLVEETERLRTLIKTGWKEAS